MSVLDIMVSRELLRRTHVDVKAFRPSINLVKDAWVHHCGRNHWEFHFTNPCNAAREGAFYWQGSASDAYDARAKGWAAWLCFMGCKGYVLSEQEGL